MLTWRVDLGSLSRSLSPLARCPRRSSLLFRQITLEPLLLQILDTPQFQRLRDLKQLGCAYLVFPGASHNRFEHCLGVAHLAHQLMAHLATTQPELGITPHEILLVKIAGLCHDLGHGPFSHSFEQFLEIVDPHTHFSHEQMSVDILAWILEENPNITTELTPEDFQFLKECMDPYSNPTQSNPKKFMYDIVANARNSVDVDKFDYLARVVSRMENGERGKRQQTSLGDGARCIPWSCCFIRGATHTN